MPTYFADLPNGQRLLFDHNDPNLTDDQIREIALTATQAPPALPAPTPAGEDPSFTEALVGGFRQPVGMAAKGLGALTGLEGLERWGEEFAEEAPRLQTFEETKQAYEEGVLPGVAETADFAKQQTGQVVGGLGAYIPAAFAGAKVGALAAAPIPIPGARIVGGAIGSIAGPTMQFFGSNIARQEQVRAEALARGEEPPEMLGTGETLATAVGQAAIERLGLGILGRFIPGLNRILGQPTREMADKELVKTVQRSLPSSIVRGATAVPAVEVPVELTQTILERNAAGLPLTTPDALQEYEEIAAATVAGTVALGGLGGAARRGAARSEQEFRELQRRTEEEAAAAEAEQAALTAEREARRAAEAAVPEPTVRQPFTPPAPEEWFPTQSPEQRLASIQAERGLVDTDEQYQVLKPKERKQIKDSLARAEKQAVAAINRRTREDKAKARESAFATPEAAREDLFGIMPTATRQAGEAPAPTIQLETPQQFVNEYARAERLNETDRLAEIDQQASARLGANRWADMKAIEVPRVQETVQQMRGSRPRMGETFGGPQREMSLIEPAPLTETKLQDLGLPKGPVKRYQALRDRLTNLDLTQPEERRIAIEEVQKVDTDAQSGVLKGKWAPKFVQNMQAELARTEDAALQIGLEREFAAQPERDRQAAVGEEVEMATMRGLEAEAEAERTVRAAVAEGMEAGVDARQAARERAQAARAAQEAEAARAADRAARVEAQAQLVRDQATGRLPIEQNLEAWKDLGRMRLEQNQEEARLREQGLDQMAADEAAAFELDMQYVDDRITDADPMTKANASAFVQQYREAQQSEDTNLIDDVNTIANEALGGRVWSGLKEGLDLRQAQGKAYLERYREAQAINDPELINAVDAEARAVLGSTWGSLKGGLKSRDRGQARRLEREARGEVRPKQPDLFAREERQAARAEEAAFTTEWNEDNIKNHPWLNGQDPEGLDAMVSNAGWAERGGFLIRDESGTVTGRTVWVPRERWWRNKPEGITEKLIQRAHNKIKTKGGDSLTKRERRGIAFLADVDQQLAAEEAEFMRSESQAADEMAKERHDAIKARALEQMDAYQFEALMDRASTNLDEDADYMDYMDEVERRVDAEIETKPEVKPKAEPKADLKEKPKAARQAAPRTKEKPKYMYAGRQAATADVGRLYDASQRVKAGEDPEIVRQETGWFQGDDGDWRFEIDDSQARLKIPFDDIVESKLFDSQQYIPLGDVLEHDALFEAYPALRDVNFIKRKGFMDFGGLQGWHNPEKNEIGITPYAKDPLSTLLHEIQHVIQTAEGFARGGSQNSVWEALPQETKENLAKNALVGAEEKAAKVAEELSYANDILKRYDSDSEFRSIADRLVGDDSSDTESVVRSELAKLLFGLDKWFNATFEQLQALGNIIYYNTRIDKSQSMREYIVDKRSRIEKQFVGKQDVVAKIKSGDEDAIKKYLSSTGDLFEYYERLAGEIESRDVQERQKLTAEERRKTSPLETRDRPPEQAIVVREADVLEGAEVARSEMPFDRAQPGERPRGIADSVVQRAVSKLRAAFPNLPEVVIARNQTESWLPQELIDNELAARREGKGISKGIYYDGKVYLFGDGLNSEADAILTGLHETLGHFGLEKVFGDTLRPILRQIVQARGKDIQAFAREYGYSLKTDEDKLIVAEEVLANLAMTKPELGFVKRAIAAIRRVLRRIPGIKNLEWVNKLTDDDIIANFIIPARAFAEGKLSRAARDRMREYAGRLGPERGGATVEKKPMYARQPAPGQRRTPQQIVQSLGETIPPPEQPKSMTRSAKQALTGAFTKTNAQGQRVRRTAADYRQLSATFGDYVATNLLSKNSAVRAAVRRAMQARNASQLEQEGVLLAMSDSQVLHRTHFANVFMEFGKAVLDNATQKYKAVQTRSNFKNLSKELTSIAEDMNVPEHEVAALWHNYMVARRLDDLRQQEAKTMQQVQALRAKGKKKKADDLQKKYTGRVFWPDAKIDAGLDIAREYPELVRLADMWNDIRSNVLDLMVSSGTFTREKAEEYMDRVGYAPFFREGQLEAGDGPREYLSKLVNSPLNKRLTASDKPVNNMLENMMRWTGFMVETAVGNHNGRRIIEELENNGLATPVKTKKIVSREDKARLVEVYQNGVKKSYLVEDPLMVKAFEGLGPAGPVLSGVLGKLMGSASELLRKTVTMNPVFTVAQLTQDAFGAMMTSGLPPQQAIKLPVEVLKEFIQTINGTSASHETLRRYGAVGERAYNANFARDAMENRLTQLNPETRNHLETILDKFEFWSMASDNAVRQAVWKLSLANGDSAGVAVERAFEIINFRRQGAWPIIHKIARITPFMNAYMQSLKVQMDMLSGGGIAPGKARREVWRAAIMNAMMLAGLSFIYAMLVGGDEEYEQMDDLVRDRMFYIPGLKMGVPLRSDMTLLPKIIGEQIYRLSTDAPAQDMPQFRQSVATALANTISSPTPLPQLFKPIIENVLNYSFWTNRPLVSPRLQELTPSLQRTPYTSQLAVLLGENMNISPIKIDNWVQGTFGSLGGLVLWISDNLGGVAGLRPSRDPFELAQSFPGMSRFLTQEHSSGLRSMFYEADRLSRVAYQSYMDRVKNQPLTANPYLEQGSNLARVAAFKEFNQISKELGEIRRNIDRFSRDINMDPDTRAYIIDQLRDYEQMILEFANIKDLRERIKMFM